MYKINMPGRKKEIKKHDIVFIWKANGKEGGRGIYEKAKVIDVPGIDREDNYWHCYVKVLEKIDEWNKQPYFDVKNIKLILENPLQASELIGKLIDDKFITRYHRWRTYKLTPEDGKTIEALFDER